MLWYLHLTKKDTLLIKSKYIVFFESCFPNISKISDPCRILTVIKTFTA